MNKRQKGTDGEKIAERYLSENGYEVIEMNYTNYIGEIDIVAINEGVTVFIEVKYRRDLKKGRPFEAVSLSKQKKIIRVSYIYARDHRLFESPMRFDVVEIVGNQIKVIKNAFTTDGYQHYL